jgi:hypothetical protein
MLFPGLLKEPSVFLESQLTDSESRQLLLIFGGNNNTSLEAIHILKGLSFSNNVILDLDQMPSIAIPLLLYDNQQAYIDGLEKKIQGYLKKFSKLERLYIAGHSLGGAIALQLIERLSHTHPDLEIFFAADRTFTQLWDVAEFRYGKVIASIMRKTFGLLWTFDSEQILELIKHRPNIACSFYQVIPDEILGSKALLLNNLLNNKESLPNTWTFSYDAFTNAQHEHLHAMPYKEVKKLASLMVSKQSLSVAESKLRTLESD